MPIFNNHGETIAEMKEQISSMDSIIKKQGRKRVFQFLFIQLQLLCVLMMVYFFINQVDDRFGFKEKIIFSEEIQTHEVVLFYFFNNNGLAQTFQHTFIIEGDGFKSGYAALINFFMETTSTSVFRNLDESEIMILFDLINTIYPNSQITHYNVALFDLDEFRIDSNFIRNQFIYNKLIN